MGRRTWPRVEARVFRESVNSNPCNLIPGKDYAISIATIHHLATHERRKLAVKVCSCQLKLVMKIHFAETTSISIFKPWSYFNIRLGR